MSDIPSDILHEILRRLPPDSLLRFRYVCKEWCRIIDDPSFVKSHASRQDYSTLVIRDYKGGCLYSLSLDSLDHTINGPQTIDATPIKQLISRGVSRMNALPSPSCNGLFLIFDHDITKNWVVWNPLTRDFRTVPLPDLNTEFTRMMSWCLGYDDATDDYKVVRIDRLKQQRDGVILFRTLVYSLKLGFWRMIKDCPFPSNMYCGRGIFLNGALHWKSQNEIIVLDLRTEDYRKLRRPTVPAKPSNGNLDALGGYLVLSCYYENAKILYGWIMRDYGVETSWTLLFSVDSWIRGVKPVAYLKRRSMVVLQESDKNLFWLDLQINSVRKISIDDICKVSSMQSYPGSLFRLDDSAAAKTTAGVKRKRASKRLTFHIKRCLWRDSTYSYY